MSTHLRPSQHEIDDGAGAFLPALSRAIVSAVGELVSLGRRWQVVDRGGGSFEGGAVDTVVVA